MRSSNLWNGVVGFWSATAGPSGFRLLDRSGRNNHGTFTSNMVSTDWSADSGRWSTLHSGTQGNGKQIRTGYLIPTTNFTAVIWAKMTSAGSVFHRPFGDAAETTGLSGVSLIFGFPFSSSVYGVFRQGSNVSSGDVSTSASFQNEVALWTVQMSANDGASVWKNGVRLAVNGTYKSITQTGQGWCLGGSGSESFFTGNIYESIIWDRVLTATEQRQLYQIGIGGMLTPRRRRKAYSVATGLRRRLLLTGQV